MHTDALRSEVIQIIKALDGEALARVASSVRLEVERAGAASAKTVNGEGAFAQRGHAGYKPGTSGYPATNPSGEPLVSFDVDGTGYTADELGDMLDATVERMRRGEGVVTLEELKISTRAWREHLK